MLYFHSSQIPHAVGAAYSLKMDGKYACAVTYFGDGGSSEVIKMSNSYRLLHPSLFLGRVKVVQG